MEESGSENPYEEMIAELEKDLEVKSKNIIDIIELFSGFLSTLQKSQIAKEVLFKKMKGDEKGARVGDNLTSVVAFYLGNIELMSSFTKHFSNVCIAPVITFKEHFDEVHNTVKNLIEKCTEILSRAEEKYKTTYDQYIHACQLLDEEKNPIKARDLIKECVVTEEMCVACSKELAQTRSMYSLKAEKVFVAVDSLNEEYYKLMNKVIDEFSDSILRLKSESHKFESEGSNAIEHLQYNGDIEVSEIEPPPIIGLCNKYDIDFDIFKYISCEKVYKNVLSRETMIVTQRINEPYVKEGEVVDVLKNDGKQAFVEIVESGIRCETDSSYISPLGYKRRIVKLKEDYTYQYKKLPKDKILCTIYERDKKVYCKNESGASFVLPIDILETV